MQHALVPTRAQCPLPTATAVGEWPRLATDEHAVLVLIPQVGIGVLLEYVCYWMYRQSPTRVQARLYMCREDDKTLVPQE